MSSAKKPTVQLTKAQKETLKKLAECARLQATREFSAGAKLASQILKKEPNNAEAIAWNAYFNFMLDQKGKKDEALAQLNQAARLELKNSRIWRIKGFINKEITDYGQALSCFKTAFRFDPADTTTLNEIVNLNLFEGHYRDFLETSRQIIQKTHMTYQVMRYSIALFLNKRYQNANDFLEKLESAWNPTTDEEELTFRSEFCLFRAMILMKLEKWEECIAYLDKDSEKIRDHVRVLENKLQCYLNLKNQSLSLKTVHQLIEIYPENGDYFTQLEKLIPDTELYISELLKIKESCKSSYAHVRALELMPISDSRWEPLLLAHIRPLLIKGAPSTYLTIADFSPEKLDRALELAKTLEVPISSVPIVHLLAAHVYGYRGETDRAIAELDAGLEHTSTCIELIAWKARFLMRAGRVAAALEQARELRLADPADRNTNLLLVKQLFLAGRRSEAVAEAREFATDETGVNLLYQVQFNAFYMQFAKASLRCGDFSRARILYAGVIKHFTDFKKGDFNYLAWASKKPRALIEMLEFVESLEKDPIFAEAAANLLQLALMDKNVVKSGDKIVEGNKTIDIKAITMRCMKCTSKKALAWAAVMFCVMKMPVQAMRCYVKLENTPEAYIAFDWMDKMMKEEKPPLIQEVLTEMFKPPQKKPETPEEMFAAAKGACTVEDWPRALSLYQEAISKTPTMSFKHALNVYYYVNNLSGGPKEFAEKISEMLTKAYPTYEFVVQKEENEDNLDIEEVQV